MKVSDRKTIRTETRYGSGEGTTNQLRCGCGHDLDRHLESEACDVEDCPCLGFEIAWDDEDEEIIRA